MSTIISLNDVRQARQLREQRAKIVLASHVDEAFAEYHECEDDVEFLELLEEIKHDLTTVSDEMFSEYFWWATAKRFAIRNHIDTIGREFYQNFDPQAHHAATLNWAEDFLAGLPRRYAIVLGGAA